MDKLLALGFGVLLLPALIVIGGLVSLVVAWPVMLLIGNASIESGGVIPSLGYWTTFWLTWAITILTNRSTASD